MADAVDDNPTGAARRRLLPRKRRWRALLLVLSLTGLAIIWAWMSREQIAGNVIQAELDRLDLPATYDIASVGPQQQRLRNLVIGDPKAADLTIDEVVVNLDYDITGPVIGSVELIGPRLFGTYRDGALSFGALDPLLFAESDEPARLPELNLAIRDGRALVESAFGAVGIKIDGSGPLDDGFSGQLAAISTDLDHEGCAARQLSAFGDVSTTSGVLSFDGPVRLRDLACEGVQLQTADIGTEIALSGDFSAVDGALAIAASDAAYGDNSLSGISGSARFALGDGGLRLTHELEMEGLETAFASLEVMDLDGSVRSDADFGRVDWNSDISGAGLALAGDADTALADATEAAEGTLLAPLIARFDRNFSAAMQGSRLNGRFTIRSSPDDLTVVVPEGRLVGGNGEAILALSRFNWSSGGEGGGTELAGNFITGGAGLPQINGRMERAGDAATTLRVTMAPYSEGDNRIAIPLLRVRQDRGGSLSFSGGIQASGDLPGGSVRGLDAPFNGTWRPSGGLSIGTQCRIVRFDALSLAQLELDARSLRLCPDRGQAILRYDDVLRMAARTDAVDLSGRLAGSSAQLAAASAVLRYPGPFALNDLRVIIGGDGSAVRLTAERLEGRFADTIGGTFTGGTAALDLVPLDLSEMSGNWRYENSVLAIDDAAFTLTERVDGVEVTQARFEPLVARDAELTLDDGMIEATAGLLHPDSARLVAQVDIDHNLSSAQGQALIDVPGVVFDEALQPDELSYLADGVVELAEGRVTGEGRIEWADGEIDSSGTFGTDGLDFAAAFGPVRQARGTIEFTDLINLTTAPSQTIELGSINPGIEVLAGRIEYAITDGTLINLESARWPFMDGELILRPVAIDYGSEGPQRYVFEMIGLDAATFVAQMELGNLDATGTFDGTVPIAFDDQGNGTIEDGLLISRPPGGNVSYIGELTYEDLGAIGDFAFQSLRSLDYSQMSVGLSGRLSGEIVTSFRIDGVRQGEGAKQNFITRQLARLPIRFRINIRSENFFQLATIARIYLDPTAARDPRALGLFELQDGRLVPAQPIRTDTPPPEEDDPENEPDIQPEAIQNRESEPMP